MCTHRGGLSAMAAGGNPTVTANAAQIEANVIQERIARSAARARQAMREARQEIGAALDRANFSYTGADRNGNETQVFRLRHPRANADVVVTRTDQRDINGARLYEVRIEGLGVDDSGYYTTEAAAKRAGIARLRRELLG